MEATEKILFTGKNILQSNQDILEPATLHEIFKQISQPDQALIELAGRLMQVKSIDENAFQAQKVKLPYFIGARFEDNLRNTENFREINWLIVDIDKCFNSLDKELELKEMLQKDQRVALMFTSPSNEGLKLVFRLNEPMTDSALFVNFYKAFTAELARHYKLEKYIDFKTSDVTRICFLNADAGAYINEDAQNISWRTYLSKYDLLNQAKPTANEQENPEEENKNNLNEDIYAEILKKLNPKTPKKPKIIFVPEVLNSITQPITKYAEKMGLQVTEIRDIHYGKKITFKRENDFAEINVFYGKNGFTVVISPKRGHHPGLSEVAKVLIEKVIFDDPVRDPDINDNKTIMDPLNHINLN
jgi:hypothetical protein